MVNCICRNCGKEFGVFPSAIKKGNGKNCSRKCSNVEAKKRIPWNKDKHNIYSEETLQKMRGPRIGFIPWSKGKKFKLKNPRKREPYLDKGYICVPTTNHPNGNGRNYVMAHRLVVEVVLGRYLDGGEVVHHINWDTTDNRVENLFVFENNGEHLRYHIICKYNPVLKTWLKSNLV